MNAEYNLFYYPYASLTNAQLPLLKVAALYFDKLIILDPVGASWDSVGADHHAREGVRLLKNAGILEIVTPATVLAKYEAPIALATAGLGLASGAVIPGTEWLLDWRDGKKTAQENGLHYLLKT